MFKRVTIPDRVVRLERQTEVLADVAANLVAISGALSSLVGTLRADAAPRGHYDAALHDLNKSLKGLQKRIEETWPEVP